MQRFLCLILFLTTIQTAKPIIIFSNSISEPSNALFHAEILIKTEPADADIYIDGTFQGKGNAKITLEVAKIVTISITREGYKNKIVELKYKASPNSEYLSFERGENFYSFLLEKEVNSTLAEGTKNSSKFDLIQKKDGSEIKAKILEINSADIKFKHYDYIEGPIITLSVSEITQIMYPNGRVEKFSSTNTNDVSLRSPILSQNQETRNIDSVKIPSKEPKLGIDSKNDIIKTYYPNGELLSETPYKDGKINGIQKLYYINGSLLSETPFIDGLANGTGKTYYKNNKWMYETPYVNGKITGTLKYQHHRNLFIRIPAEVKFIENKGYYPTGELYEEIPFGNGIINGIVKYYRKTGELYATYEYQNNVPCGRALNFNKKGQIYVADNFKDGEIVNGNIILAITQGLQQGIAYNNMVTNTNTKTVSDYMQIAINNETKDSKDALLENNSILEKTATSSPTTSQSSAIVEEKKDNNRDAAMLCATQGELEWKNSQEYKNYMNNPDCHKMAYISKKKLAEILLINCRTLLPPAEVDGFIKTIEALTQQINSMENCKTYIYGK